MGWTWYLHCDMQLYAFSVFILLLYKHSKTKAKIILWILVALSLFYAFIWVLLKGTHVVVNSSDNKMWGEYSRWQYAMPYGRFPSYLPGVYMGMLYL
jgi:hypothetical protein